MNLQKLKKELRKQGPDARRNKRRTLLLSLLGLVLCVLLLASWAGYRVYQETVPGRLYSKGLTLESRDRPEQALASYRRLFEGYPDAPMAAETLFRAGRICRYDLRQDQQALLYFLKLEHDYPDSVYLTRAQQEAADLSKNRLHDYAHAVIIYQRLLESGAVAGDQVLYEIADCYFRLNNYAQARIELDTLLERYPHSPLRAEVFYRRASAFLLDDREDEARKAFQRLIEDFPKSSYAEEARFGLAEILETEENLREALQAYRRLTDYPRQDVLQEKIEHLEARIAKKKKAL